MMSLRSTNAFSAGLLLASAALLAACGHDEKARELPVISGVATEVVKASAEPQVQSATATLRARTTSPVSAKLLGNVVAIHVKEGDRVKQGDLLLEMDSREVAAGLSKASAGIEEMDRAIAAAEAAFSAADANRALAASTYERYKGLRDRRSVSPQEFEEVEARYRAANGDAERAQQTQRSLRARRRQVEADVSSAKTYVSYARLTAPIGGIVASKSVEVGAQAAPGMPLMVVEDDRTFEADAAVEESLSGRVRPGDRVRVRVPSIGAVLEGRVARVVPALDPSTRTSLVKIQLPPDPRLRSGLFAEVEFPVGQRSGVVAVPASAITRTGQLESIFVLDGQNVSRLRLVRSGRASEGRVEILAGLDPGERIIVDASRGRDGAKVEEAP